MWKSSLKRSSSLLPPNHDFMLFFITCPLLHLESKKEREKNAGTLLINKAALLSGEVECVYFYPQGHSSDFRCSWVLNRETFCVGSQAALKWNRSSSCLKRPLKSFVGSNKRTLHTIHFYYGTCVLFEHKATDFPLSVVQVSQNKLHRSGWN